MTHIPGLSLGRRERKFDKRLDETDTTDTIRTFVNRIDAKIRSIILVRFQGRIGRCQPSGLAPEETVVNQRKRIHEFPVGGF